ncbi:polysaccharide biosynthesis protein, partial [Acidocella sp.]|uniref:polysaccharide biosynthesis protein n=1 Tax=Acidocella sp. TaxID=50710 RepID=UPI00262E858A
YVDLGLGTTIIQAEKVDGAAVQTRPDYAGVAGVGYGFGNGFREPLRILDLARQMIQLAGLRPETDIKIEFTGIRPGEKLFEQLFHGAETPRPTSVPGLLVATPRRAALAEIRAALDELSGLAAQGDTPAALALLQRQVPEFLPPAPLAERAAAE